MKRHSRSLAAVVALALALTLAPNSRSERAQPIRTVAVATPLHAEGAACAAHRVADLVSESLARRAPAGWAVLARTQVLQRARGVALPGTMTGTQLPELATRLSATVVVGGSVEGDQVSLVVYDMRTGAKTTLEPVAAAAAADALAKPLGFDAADPGATPSTGFPEGRACEAYAAARGGFDKSSPAGLKASLKLALAARSAAPEHARVQAHAAQVMIRSGQVEEGLQLAQAAAQSAPGLADAHFAVALAHDYANAFSKAADAYEKAGELSAGFGDARANQGLVLLRSGDLGGAIDALQEALALDQGSDAARINLAVGSIAAGDGALALRVLEPVRSDSPHADLVRLTKGQALIRLGRTTQAMSLLSMLVGEPGRLGEEARYEMALAQLQEGDVDKAAPGFQQVAEESKNPQTRVRAGVGVARTALAKKDVEAAKGILEWLAGKTQGESPLLDAAKALLKAQTDDAAGALADFAAALAQRSYDHEAWYNYGVLLQRQGEHEQAATAYTKAVAANPRAYWAQLNLGLLHLEHGRHAEAVEALEAAAVGDPRAGDVANALGAAYAHAGQRAKALATWRDYVKRARAARPGWPIPAALTANLKALEASEGGQ